MYLNSPVASLNVPVSTVRIAVPKEIKAGEKRVALVPDIISKLTKAGLEVVIESGAGVNAQAADQEFKTAGADVKSGDVLTGADVVLSVQPLTPAQIQLQLQVRL